MWNLQANLIATFSAVTTSWNSVMLGSMLAREVKALAIRTKELMYASSAVVGLKLDGSWLNGTRKSAARNFIRKAVKISTF